MTDTIGELTHLPHIHFTTIFRTYILHFLLVKLTYSNNYNKYYLAAIPILHLVIPAAAVQNLVALFLIDATLLQRVIAPLALAESPVGEPVHACESE